MATSATTVMLSARLASRQFQRTTASALVSRRSISSTRRQWAAQNFTMPAMSPTMTEGNIASWKVKEGDSFAVGDVLLEIETDKAQMDVEAQDDGKVAKITHGDGTKGVKVGTRIAVLAEASDDLDTLEIPADDKQETSPSKKTSEPAQKDSPSNVSKKSPTNSKSSSESSPLTAGAQVKDPAATKSSSSKPQTQKYPLYPSVQMLLHANGLSTSDANNIQATGPNGRLLKGDVLAHLGRLSEKGYPEAQAERIKKLSHLDLSNIKKAAPKAAAPKKEEAKKVEAVEEPDTEVAVPISLAAVLSTQKRIQDSLGLHLPLSTFIARASELANEELPRGRSTPPTSGELFDAVLGLDKVEVQTTRGTYIPQVTVLSPPGIAAAVSAPKRKVDIIDLLAGKKACAVTRPSAMTIPGAAGVASAGGANNVFSVSVKKGDETRARVYLERVKTVLEQEPGQLVL